MIIRFKGGVLRGIRLWVQDFTSYSSTYPFTVLVLEGGQTLMPCPYGGPPTSGYVSYGNKYTVHGRRINNAIKENGTIAFYESQLSMLKKQALGKPDKKKQKELLECVPI